MNKRDLLRTKIANLNKPFVFNHTGEYKLADTIYLVKYKEIYHILSSNITRNNTYNLLTFKNLDSAKEYMNLAYEYIVIPDIKSGNFKVILDNTTNELQTTKNGNRIMYERCTKIIGATDSNTSQSKFFTLTVEEMSYLPYMGINGCK